MGNTVCHAVQLVIVLTFVDPHTPQNDAGVISVLQHHLPGVFHGLLFPVRAADVLPAGNLREHQQTEAVALVKEIVTLGVVGGAHRDTSQFFLEDSSVLPLETFWSGVADVGPALVPVQPPQEGLLPI